MEQEKGENSGPKIEDSARDEKLAELDVLKQSLNDKQAEVLLYQDQLLRLKAEFENYRKRLEKEKQNSYNWGKEEVLLRFISVMDIFHQAEEHMKTATDIKGIQQGFSLIKHELENFLKAEGVSVIEAMNQKFDTQLHDAIDHEENDSVKEETVVGEIQKGYKFNDVIIRPAKVKVAVPKSKEKK